MRACPRLLIPLLALGPAIGWSLDIKAKSAIVIDAGSGKVLWEKDAHTVRYPASTTKIMTGLLLIEHTRPTDVITAPPEIKDVKESSMHLQPWEKVTAQHLLYALMLRSANDGCYAVAKHLAGTIPAFAQMMNERAREIGCENTHFNNPNGLNDRNHYTTAYDLALMGREAMRHPEFREVVKTQKYQIVRSKNQGDRIMVNRNKLLRKDATIEGIKTGWTIPAGHCFVGAATRFGFRAVTAIMKSENWQSDNQNLLAFAYKQYEVRDSVKSGTEVGTVDLPGAAAPVPVVSLQDAYTLARKVDAREGSRQIVPVENLEGPVTKGQLVAHLILRDPDGFEQVVPLGAAQDVAAAGIVRRSGQSPSFLLFGGALVAGAWWMRERSKRVRRRFETAAAKSRI